MHYALYMESLSHPVLTETLAKTLKAAFEGSEAQHGWYNGLLYAIESLDAAQASKHVAEGRPSIAAHTEHVRFCLDYLNRSLQGQNPQVDWADSWKVQTVSPQEWAHLIHGLRQEYQTLLQLVQNAPEWSGGALAAHIHNVAHTAYHAGAVRQLAALIK